MPQDYVPPPPIDDVVAYYVEAFYTISRSRNYDHGMPLPISISNVRDYADVYGVVGPMTNFMDIVFQMDEVYLPHKLKSIEQARKKAAKQPSAPPGMGRRR